MMRCRFAFLSWIILSALFLSFVAMRLVIRGGHQEIIITGRRHLQALQTEERDLSLTSHQSEMNSGDFLPYSQAEIEWTVSKLKTFYPRLLVWNTTHFEVYNLYFEKDGSFNRMKPNCERCGEMVALLVSSLLQLYPGRFEPYQSPVFEMLFMDGDGVSTHCHASRKKDCMHHNKYAPLLAFGSVPSAPTDRPPFVEEAFPNWFFLECMYEHQLFGKAPCAWAERPTVVQDISTVWDSLKPTCGWRGSDLPFLPFDPKWGFPGTLKLSKKLPNLMNIWEKLEPRWRAVALTIEAQQHQETDSSSLQQQPPWIDCKFTKPQLGKIGKKRSDLHMKLASIGVEVVDPTFRSTDFMAQYRYQIDFGGIGGTTWRGTITKLGLPGLLFHHVTTYEDFFYDKMEAWVHYVPIDWSLNDLKEKFLWAESHVEEAKAISRRATGLYHQLLSAEYMEEVHTNLFKRYVRNVADRYRGENGRTWSDKMAEYTSKGFTLQQVGFCDSHDCHFTGQVRNFAIPKATSSAGGTYFGSNQ